MPRGVNEGSKRDRQCEHIKESYEERGVAKDEVEERAARTVNQQRHAAGETQAQRDEQRAGVSDTSRDRVRTLARPVVAECGTSAACWWLVAPVRS